VTRGSTDTTANIENIAPLRQCRTFKQEFNQLNLSLLLGVGRSQEIAMVNMLAPGFSVN
jgi:hypothetical protein